MAVLKHDIELITIAYSPHSKPCQCSLLINRKWKDLLSLGSPKSRAQPMRPCLTHIALMALAARHKLRSLAITSPLVVVSTVTMQLWVAGLHDSSGQYSFIYNNSTTYNRGLSQVPQCPNSPLEGNAYKPWSWMILAYLRAFRHNLTEEVRESEVPNILHSGCRTAS